MIRQLREKVNLPGICKVVPTVLFLLFIGFVMIRSFPGEVLDHVSGASFHTDSLFSCADGFEDVLQNSIYGKNTFIDLNGLYARILGQNSLNDRLKMKNGALTAFPSVASMEEIMECADQVEELNQFLKQRDISFLYLLAPNKRTIYDAEFPPGYGAGAEENIDNMVNALRDADVDVIDLNAWCEQNGWHSEDVLFKTDHHWKPEAALQAARLTMEFLQEQGVSDYYLDWYSEDQWTIEVWEDHFLGTEGKRTGIPYAGLDDISIYKPKFPTEYRYSRLVRDTTTWHYHDQLLDESYKDRKEYYTDSPYCAYMHSDPPLRITQNEFGWNKQRVLLMGDSFKLPYEYFLTVQFQEVYTMDLRYYTDGSFVQAIESIDPDIVLMCTNAPTNPELHTFGTKSHMRALEETAVNDFEITVLGDFSLEAQAENKDHFALVCSNLEPGRTYTITVEQTDMQSSNGSFLQMSLQNLSTNKAIYNHYFDANYEGLQRWVFTIPNVETNQFAIFLYAGTKGHTTNISAQVRNVTLCQGVLTEVPAL